MLPQDFLDRMREMLGEEYPAFIESYDRARYQSLRLNTLKAERENFAQKSPFELERIPWCENGFYYGEEERPGKHPYHEAGVYYIQEPSAMAPVEYLMQNMEGALDSARERILDLCAAPGGKSTQIAAAMGGEGILICNEIHPARAKILSENVERMGIRNAMVTNETPQKLSEHFSDFFTRILVDAPCSGEGMFRKNEEATEEWSLSNVELCAGRQDEILDCAASMLAPGGRLVYSTCTFAPAENEGSMARFLARHPEFSIEEVELTEGMRRGVSAWANWDSLTKEDAQTADVQAQAAELEMGDAQAQSVKLESLARTIRLWPQHLRGEGHYLAVLRKEGELRLAGNGWCRNGIEQGILERERKILGKGIVEYEEFAKEALSRGVDTLAPRDQAAYLKFGDQLYLIPPGMPSVKGLKVLRPGLHLGTIKKNRFEPSHALALAITSEEASHAAELTVGREVYGYINGETFSYEGDKGWYLIEVEGYSLGWGKLAGGVMKNHYPKGLRRKLD